MEFTISVTPLYKVSYAVGTEQNVSIMPVQRCSNMNTRSVTDRYRGQSGYLSSDGHQIFLQEPLLVGDLVGMGRLLLVLLHLLVGHVQYSLQLVLRVQEVEHREGNSNLESFSVNMFSSAALKCLLGSFEISPGTFSCLVSSPWPHCKGVLLFLYFRCEFFK